MKQRTKLIIAIIISVAYILNPFDIPGPLDDIIITGVAMLWGFRK